MLLAVGGDLVVVDVWMERLGLTVLQIETLNGLLLVGFAQEEDLAGRTGVQLREIGGRDRQVENARIQSVEVDSDGLGRGRRLGLLIGLHVGLAGLLLPGVLALVFGDAFGLVGGFGRGRSGFLVVALLE